MLLIQGEVVKLVLLGAPGAGKGTQAARIAEKLSIAHISTGQMLRETTKEDTPLARELKSFLDSGKLVPDDKMNEVVRTRLSKPDTDKGFILDGYPRTTAQAGALEEALGARNLSLDAALYFSLPREEAVRRLSGRRTCKGCGANFHVQFSPPETEGICDKCGAELYQRDDDNPEVINRRFEEYRQKTADLIDFYKEKGLLKEIDATPEPEQIFSRVLETLGLAH